MFIKSTLKNVLPAALLLASASAFAQVTLGDGKTTATWADVVSALNGTGTNIDVIADSVTILKNALDRIEPKSETTVPTWLKTAQDEVTKFKTSYTAYINKLGEGTDATLWYKLTTNIDDESTLTLAFTQQTTGTAEGDWKEASAKDFYTTFVSSKTTTKPEVAILYIYITGYTDNNSLYEVTTYSSTQQKNIITLAADVLNNTLPTLKAFQTTGPTEKYQKALDALNEKEARLATVQAAQKNYNTLTLTADVEATETIANYAGTINGNGYAITAPSNGDVFTKFTGSISKAAINGSLAGSSMGATLDNVAIWDSTNGTGTFYNANGVATDYTSLGELAFAARNTFGVAAGKLARVNDTNKVYSITVYPSATSQTNYYATYNNGYTNVATGQAINVAANVFVKSATADLNADNVIYNGTANNVVITDKTDFYCPEDITAAKVTFDRQFVAGYNGVTLPFEIKASDLTSVDNIGTFDHEDAEAGSFIFNKIEGAIAANTPVLLNATAAFTLPALENVSIAKTADQIIAGANNSYGFLKKSDVTEVLGVSNAPRVFGVTAEGFQNGSATATINSFRMVVASEMEVPANAPKQLRAIVFLDADGNESSAVEAVAAEAEDLEVVGGQGVITITSSADLGNVTVYTMDGKVVANANVAAGTTNVNVQKGLYLVNGLKVLVK